MNENKIKHLFRRLGVIPVPAFIAIMATLVILNIRVVFEPPLLLFILNTLFISVMSFAVAYLAARAYLTIGSSSLLLLGCGVLAFGAASLVAGWLIGPPGGPNVAVMIHNTGALLGSAFHLASAALTLTGVTSARVPKRGKPNVILAYLGVLGFTALLTIASLQGAIPPFFIQGAGPTLLRQVVLGTAATLFAISALLLMRLYLKSKSGFLYWYSLALALIAVGLSAVFLQKAVGSPIGWAGRSAQYLAGIYFLIAVSTAIRGARAKGIPLERLIADFFREGEELYRALVKTVSDAIISVDHEGRVLLWNSAAERMFGYSRGEAVGSPLIDLIVPDKYAESLRKEMERLATAGKSSLIGKATEVEAKRKDGEVFPVEFSISARKTAGGWVSTCIIRDITERKRAEEALKEYSERLEVMVEERTKELRESETKHRNLTESLDEVIYRADPETFVTTYVNRAVERIYGYTVEEWLGDPTVWEMTIHPEDKERVLAKFTEAQRKMESGFIEYRIIAKDKTVRWVENHVSWEKDQQGNVVSMNGMMYDITERKLAQGRIVRLNTVLDTLRNVNQLIVREKDRGRLVQQACELLDQGRSYEKAWILLMAENGEFMSFTSAGLAEKAPILLEQLKAGDYPPCLRELLAQKEPFLISAQPGLQHEGCVLADSHTNKGVFRCMLEHEGKVFGVLGVTVPLEVVSDKEEQQLFLEVCTDLSYALAGIETEEQRRRAEEETNRIRESLQLQVNRMPIGLIVWDTEFQVQSWNPAAEDIFGFTEEEALGKHPYDIIVPKEAQPHVEDIWRRLLEGDTTAHSINDNTTKDGRTITCQWSNTPLKESDGTVRGVLSMVQDITERKQAEEALRKLKEFNEGIIQGMVEGIFVEDVEGVFSFVNPAGAAMLGYEPEELLGHHGADIVPADQQPIVQAAEERRARGESDQYELELVRKDGVHLSVLMSGSPRFEEGRFAGTLGVFADITRRKRAEEEAKVLQDQLRQSQKMEAIGQLAGGIAHDFNNLLTIIKGYSQLSLLKLKEGDPLKGNIEEIQKASERASNLTRQILAFSRRQVMEMKVFDLNTLLRDLEKMLRRVIGEDVELVTVGQRIWEG